MTALEALTEDLTAEELREMHELLQAEAMQQALKAERRMLAIGRLNRDGAQALNGVGELTHRMDPFHYWAQVGLQRANPLDPEFKPWLLKRPESEYARVDPRPHRVTLCIGSVTDGAAKRFSKSYQ
jgi:hypothetical protein